MPHTYHELKQKTVAELRELAKDLKHEAVQGYSQMNKERLLPALCRAFGIDMLEHHVVTGLDKSGIKAKIRELKQQRDRALDIHDHPSLKNIRRQLHALNHRIRAHMS
jgi:DNA-binding IclR family transcriptional regulator